MTQRDRSKTLGGSDMGVIMGVSSYSTPVELWMEKTSRKPPKDFSKDRATQAGHEFEPIILGWYERAHNTVLNRFIRPDGSKIIHKTPVPYIVVEFDAIDEFNEVVVDAKNKSSSAFYAGFGSPDLQEIPKDILCQQQLYMWAANLKNACVAVKYDSFQYIEFPLTRNDKLINEMLDAADRFWHCVQNDKAPIPKKYVEALMLWEPEQKIYIEPLDTDFAHYQLYCKGEALIREGEEMQEVAKKALMDRVSATKTHGIMLDKKKKMFTCSLDKNGIKKGRVNV